MDEWITYRRRRNAAIGSTRPGKDGYLWIKVSEKPSRWMLAHRWAMEQKLGRALLPSENVHHVCHDKACFDQDHLELLHLSDHMRHHQTGRKQSKEMVENRIKKATLYWSQPENRRQHGEKMRRFWADPEYRAKIHVGRKRGWVKRRASGKPHNAIGRKDSPEVIERRSQMLRQYWSANRTRASEIAKKRWADPAYRAKQALAQRARRDREKSQ